jgi:hypothetical protein
MAWTGLRVGSAKTAFFGRLKELNEGRRQSGVQPGSSVQLLTSTKCFAYGSR